jgi:hypothetical protein
MLCTLLWVTGCESESVTPETTEQVAITLSASSLPVPVDIQTRAESLNTKTIGIVAANADNSTINWSSYYLNHVKATGTDANLNGEKAVNFEGGTRYWPFNPAEYLGFVAYSPFHGSDGDARVERVAGTDKLKVTANATNAFPDFIYTEPVGPYNKVYAQGKPNEAVSLGEFQHAMAKLDIKIQLVDKQGIEIPSAQFPNPNPLRITELKVSTKVKSGEFDLLQATTPKTWTLDALLPTEEEIRTHIGSSTTLTATLPTYTCFLLPETHNDSFVSVKINDGVGYPEVKEKISGFKDGEDGAILEMGKTTLLTIKVVYVGIPDPNPTIILEGQLVEWDYKGKSTVTIE